MSETNPITSHPLYWPEGWKRTKTPGPSRFGDHSNKKALDMVLHQLQMMGIPDWMVIISSNLKLKSDGYPYSSQKEPDDSGVSVWWRDGEKWDIRRVMAVDDWNTCSENLWAIAKTLEAFRGIDRWSSSEIMNRTFKGFAALPFDGKKSWRTVLDYAGNDIQECKQQYYKMRSIHHPDRDGERGRFHEVNVAWLEAKEELS